MKLYIDIKKMTFEEENNEIEHNIIFMMDNKEFFGYDIIFDVPDDDKFIKDTFKIIYKNDKDNKETKEIESTVFVIREQDSWWSFPIYEIVSEKIIPFDYKKYQYFAGTNRRIALGKKVSTLYNFYSEMKIHRKTLKYIMDTLQISYPENFEKYNTKIEELISKNPKY